MNIMDFLTYYIIDYYAINNMAARLLYFVLTKFLVISKP